MKWGMNCSPLSTQSRIQNETWLWFFFNFFYWSSWSLSGCYHFRMSLNENKTAEIQPWGWMRDDDSRMHWYSYVFLKSAISRILRETGGFWFCLSQRHSRSTVVAVRKENEIDSSLLTSVSNEPVPPGKFTASWRRVNGDQIRSTQ